MDRLTVVFVEIFSTVIDCAVAIVGGFKDENTTAELIDPVPLDSAQPSPN